MNIALNLIGMNPREGGMYQYAVTFARHLLTSDRTNHYVLFYDDESILREGFNLERTTPVAVDTPMHLGFRFFGRKLWTPQPQSAQRVLRVLRRKAPVLTRYIRGDYSVFAQHKARMLIQPSHVTPDAVLSGLPYLIAIHDSPFQWNEEHRRTRTAGFLAWYESLIRELARNATVVLVDSRNGADAMVKGYGVPEHRIRILPFRPPDYISEQTEPTALERVRARFDLQEPFFFYPSKFHAHKNHLGVLEALTLLSRCYGIRPNVVFAGSTSNDDTFARVMSSVQERGMSDQVKYIGYVADEEMGALYTLALALVFPSFMGPTAIPILEAFAVGCPVICANVEGYPEQVGQAGILVDPTSPDALAEAMLAVYRDQRLRDELREKGKARFRTLTAGNYGREILATVQTLVKAIERTC